MDGTLLNEKMEISDRSLKAIHDAQENGIEFLIATGRSLSEAKPFLKGKVKPGYITLNGAEVFDKNEELISSNPISVASKKRIVEILHENDAYFELITNKGNFTDNYDLRVSSLAELLMKLNPGTSYEKAFNDTKERIKSTPMKVLDNYDAIIADPSYKIMKFICYDSRDEKFLKPLSEKIGALTDVVVTSSAPNDIEINSIDAQKGTALLEYAKDKDIKQSETMAIGDNLNDMSMFKMAGVGVAMANAVESISQVADQFTDSNINDGVAKAIEKVIAENKK